MLWEMVQVGNIPVSRVICAFQMLGKSVNHYTPNSLEFP